MPKDINNKSEKKKAGRVLISAVAVAIAAVAAAAVFLIYNSDAVQYSIAVGKIEDGSFKDGYDILVKIAEGNKDYKDTNELLYTRAIELIETGSLENKKAAYRMLEQIYGYKYTDDIAYYLWAEDVYDPDDDNTFEQANEFIAMIPENYDGPFADKVAQYRSDIKASVAELNRKKAEAALESDEEFFENGYRSAQ